MRTVQDCLTLLATDLEALGALNASLEDRDRKKYRDVSQKCTACGKVSSLVPHLMGSMEHVKLSVEAFLEQAAVFRCTCGHKMPIQRSLRRGTSQGNVGRQALFDGCLRKVLAASQLTEEQVRSLLRHIFIASILSFVKPEEGEGAPKVPVIELHDIHKSYRLGTVTVEALRGASLSLVAGEFVALIGASGSGKSTLMNIIGCLDRPTSGQVLIDGTDVIALSAPAKAALRNRFIGFVFQSFNLLPVLNVFENIELPLLARKGMGVRERRERVLRVIEDVELTAFLLHRPDHLSGGQRQRVAIARALVGEPSIVIADEPTANLDSRTAHHIVDLMVEMNELRGVTFLVSTHDERLVNRVRRIVRIADGVITNL